MMKIPFLLPSQWPNTPTTVHPILTREKVDPAHTTLVLKSLYKSLLRHIHSCNDLRFYLLAVIRELRQKRKQAEKDQ